MPIINTTWATKKMMAETRAARFGETIETEADSRADFSGAMRFFVMARG
jgi:hypothetical protein